jgi:UDP-N-acetylenolpyruvoylglucosamine reductase
MEAIRKHVLDAKGVELEYEVKIWRNEPDEGESRSS